MLAAPYGGNLFGIAFSNASIAKLHTMQICLSRSLCILCCEQVSRCGHIAQCIISTRTIRQTADYRPSLSPVECNRNPAKQLGDSTVCFVPAVTESTLAVALSFLQGRVLRSSHLPPPSNMKTKEYSPGVHRRHRLEVRTAKETI